MRISDWSSDVCSSDLVTHARLSIRVAHGKGRAAAVDLSGKSGHFLQLAQIAEAAALLAVAHDLRAMPIETRNSVEFCGAGGIDVGGGHRDLLERASCHLSRRSQEEPSPALRRMVQLSCSPFVRASVTINRKSTRMNSSH